MGKLFLKKLYFVLIRGILPTIFVAYSVFFIGMRLKKYFGCSFLNTLQKRLYKSEFSVPTTKLKGF